MTNEGDGLVGSQESLNQLDRVLVLGQIFLLHQPSGGFEGQASDIERHAEDIIKMKRRLNEIYVRHTGQDYATIEKTLDRDYFLSAEDARTFGIVDKVITKRDPLDEKIQKLIPVS